MHYTRYTYKWPLCVCLCVHMDEALFHYSLLPSLNNDGFLTVIGIILILLYWTIDLLWVARALLETAMLNRKLLSYEHNPKWRERSIGCYEQTFIHQNHQHIDITSYIQWYGVWNWQDQTTENNNSSWVDIYKEPLTLQNIAQLICAYKKEHDNTLTFYMWHRNHRYLQSSHHTGSFYHNASHYKHKHHTGKYHCHYT